MSQLSELSQLMILVLLALPCLLLLVQHFCRKFILNSTTPEELIAPAELAFLARNGDMTHTMVVLGFDLFHRALKKGDSDTVVLLPYEERLWFKTKDFLKSKAQHEVSKVVTLPKPSNPVQFVAQLSGLYRLLTGKVRQVVRQVLSDPRQLRNYFSPAALGRFVTDVLSSGYKDMISHEVIASLMKKGLLVSEKRREELSSWLLIMACVGLAVLANAAFALVANLPIVVLLVIMAAVNAVVLKLALSTLQIIPLYEEIDLVLKHVPVKNTVVRICRLVSSIARALVVTLVVLLVLLALSVDTLMLLLISAHAVWKLLFFVVLLSVNCFVLLNIFLDTFWLKLTPTLSSAGVEIVHRKRRELANSNIVESFKTTLANTNYDPSLSEILAVYGYETLWLLT